MPDLDDTDPELLRKLRKAGRRWGPLGVALAAARLTDPRAVIGHLRRPTPGPATPSCDEPGHDHSTSACLGPRPITVGDAPDPLPSELLAPSGIAGWVLTPEVLDRLPVLMRDPVPPGGLLPEPEAHTGLAHDPTVDGPPNPYEPLDLDGVEVHPGDEVAALRTIATKLATIEALGYSGRAEVARECARIAGGAVERWAQRMAVAMRQGDEPDEVSVADDARERAARAYFAGDYLPPGTPQPDTPEAAALDGARVAYRGGWGDALAWHDPEACEGQADTLRAEVARLSAYGTEQYERAERHRERADHAERSCAEASRVIDDTRRELAAVTIARDEERRQREAAERSLTDCRDTAQHRLDEWDATRDERDQARAQVIDLGRQLDEAHANLALYRDRLRPVTADAAPATTDQTGRPITRPPLESDSRRPHLGDWPDDGVTLTYRELRNLIAVHLDHAHESPATGAALARAMRDDNAPLRLVEVLDR